MITVAVIAIVSHISVVMIPGRASVAPRMARPSSSPELWLAVGPAAVSPTPGALDAAGTAPLLSLVAILRAFLLVGFAQLPPSRKNHSPTGARAGRARLTGEATAEKSLWELEDLEVGSGRRATGDLTSVYEGVKKAAPTRRRGSLNSPLRI